MAKKNGSDHDEPQADMFPVDPKVIGLGIVDMRLKDGQVECKVCGATNVNGIESLTADSWRHAIARWLLDMCEPDGTKRGEADLWLMRVRSELEAIEEEQEARRQAERKREQERAERAGAH